MFIKGHTLMLRTQLRLTEPEPKKRAAGLLRTGRSGCAAKNRPLGPAEHSWSGERKRRTCPPMRRAYRVTSTERP